MGWLALSERKQAWQPHKGHRCHAPFKCRNRRQILDSICLNRQVSDVTLVNTKRKPFDFWVERLDLKKSRDNCRIFEPWTPSRDAFATAFFGQREPHLNELWAMSENAA
jgi:hypothetical protein